MSKSAKKKNEICGEKLPIGSVRFADHDSLWDIWWPRVSLALMVITIVCILLYQYNKLLTIDIDGDTHQIISASIQPEWGQADKDTAFEKLVDKMDTIESEYKTKMMAMADQNNALRHENDSIHAELNGEREHAASIAARLQKSKAKYDEALVGILHLQCALNRARGDDHYPCDPNTPLAE